MENLFRSPFGGLLKLRVAKGLSTGLFRFAFSLSGTPPHILSFGMIYGKKHFFESKKM